MATKRRKIVASEPMAPEDPVEVHYHLSFNCVGVAHEDSCNAMTNPTSDTEGPPPVGGCSGPDANGFYTCSHPYV